VIAALQAAIPEYRPNRSAAKPADSLPTTRVEPAPAGFISTAAGRTILPPHTERPNMPHIRPVPSASCDASAS
jgi:hypothetical protein